MRISRLSIRWRLTLQYATILLVLLGVSSFAVYYFVRTAWDDTLDDRLMQDLATVRTYLDTSPKGDPQTGHVPGDVYFMAKEGKRSVYHSDAWCRARFLKEAFTEPVDPHGVWRSSRGQGFRLKSTAMRAGGRNLRVTVAEDTADMQDALTRLWGILVTQVVVGLGCALAAGYFMAGRALAPIGRMATKAREITADRLSERLPVDNPNDEIGRMSKVMNETLARLETSFAQLRAYTGNISHELRTPLTAIRSVGEVSLQSAHSPEELREAIGSMLEEVERLARLVDCFLTLARAEAGVLPLDLQDVDLAACTQAVVDLLRVLADEKGQELSFTATGPVTIQGDAALLRQSLINVIDNAIRYTPREESIAVSVSQGHGKAEILVRDGGRPIPEEELSRFFERFYRGDGTSRSDGGTGLGLAIARWVVEAHYGEIGFISTDREGNCCRIMLPSHR
jgi:heavy metal sensor kinase